MNTPDFKVNIDLKTLETLVKYAKLNGVTEHKTITVTYSSVSGIGTATFISSTWDSERTDVTNYEVW